MNGERTPAGARSLRGVYGASGNDAVLCWTRLGYESEPLELVPESLLWSWFCF
jgi:hypothetical protein